MVGRFDKQAYLLAAGVTTERETCSLRIQFRAPLGEYYPVRLMIVQNFTAKCRHALQWTSLKRVL